MKRHRSSNMQAEEMSCHPAIQNVTKKNSSATHRVMRGKIVSKKLGREKQVKKAKTENLSVKLEVKMPEDP